MTSLRKAYPSNVPRYILKQCGRNGSFAEPHFTIRTTICLREHSNPLRYKTKLGSHIPYLAQTGIRHFSSAKIDQSPMAISSKVAVVGAAGSVGSTLAYSLILSSAAGEILLSDPQTDVVKAQAEDLSDACYQSESVKTTVRATEDPSEAGQCDIIIITAGAAQKEGESRADLVGKNVSILKKVFEGLKPIKKESIVLVVANPVDALTYFAQEYSGLPRSQVFGSGTFLDTSRLRGILAKKTGVAASNIMGYVLGEHGESQFVAWSSVNVGGSPLDQVISSKDLDKEAIAEETRKKAGALIQNKGNTEFGIGAVTTSLCQSILSDLKVIRSVSHWQEEYGVPLSLPAVVGRKGILQTIPISLSSEEKQSLKASAESLKQIIEEAKKSQ